MMLFPKLLPTAAAVAAISLLFAGAAVAQEDAPAQDAAEPHPGIELRTTWPGNVAFTSQKPAALSLWLDNISNARAQYVLRVTVKDWYGRRNKAVSRTVALAALGRYHQAIPIDLSRPDYYSITAEAFQGGKPIQRIWRGIVVVVRPASFGVDDPASFFGIQDDGDVAASERLGIKWVRTNADPDPASLRVMRQHHQLPLATIWPFHWGGNQTDVYLGPLPDTDLLDNVIRTDAPYVAAFEIQNEPDLTFGEQVHADFKTSVAYYLNVMRQVSVAVRRVAPQVPVTGIDISGVDYDADFPFLKAILADGGGKYVDILTCHPYREPRNFGPGLYPFWPVTDQLASKCEETLALIRHYGGKQPFWIGEKGRGLDVKADLFGVYSHDYASCVEQDLITAKSVPGVRRYFWYDEDDNGDENSGCGYGLFRNGQPVPAAVAYATVARMLDHADPYLSPQRKDSLQVHCFVCRELHTATLVLWNNSETPATFSVARMPAQYRAFDMMGNPIASNSRSGLRLLLDRSPVYIQFPAKAAGGVCAAIAGGTTTSENPLTIETAYLPDLSHVTVRLRNMDLTAIAGRVRVGSGARNISVPGGGSKTVTLPAPAGLALARVREVPVAVTVGKRTVMLGARADVAPCKQVHGISAGGLLAAWETPPDFVLDKRSQILPPDSGIGWNGPSHLNVNAWTGWDDSALYLSIRVHDPIHTVPDSSLANFYNADSVQVAIDPHNSAAPGAEYDQSDVELGLVLGHDGPHVYLTAPTQKPLQIPCAIVRQEQDALTVYQVAVPWSLLGVTPRATRVFGFNFIVNQNNGNGRIYWMGVTPGIGERKEPWVYKKFYLERTAE